MAKSQRKGSSFQTKYFEVRHYLKFASSNGQQPQNPVEHADGQEVGGRLHPVLGGDVCQPLDEDRPHRVVEVSLYGGEHRRSSVRRERPALGG